MRCKTGACIAAALIILVPAVAFADASGSSGVEIIGKAIGMALFGFIVLRIVNRKRDENGKPTTSFVPWLLGFAAILFAFMWLMSKVDKPITSDEIAVLKAKAYGYCESDYRSAHPNESVKADVLTWYCRCAVDMTPDSRNPSELQSSKGHIEVDLSIPAANECRLQAGMQPLPRF